MSGHQGQKDWHIVLNERRSVLQSVSSSAEDAAATVELDQSRVGRLSRMDALAGQAMAQETQRRRTLQLQRIDAALSRLANGNFGVCLHCENQIPIQRLDADPCVTLCVACAETAERQPR